MIQACKDCSVNYEVTEGEVDFYKAKGFPLPKRCEDCRKKKRAQYPQDKRDRPSRTY